MEEDKVEGKVEDKNCCANCPLNKCKMGRCCGHRCHGMFKILIPLILLALAFYAGAIFSNRDGFKGRMEGQRFMDKLGDTNTNLNNSSSGSVTVDVLPPDTNTKTPPVLE